ncbi:hypothetical protein DV515_00016704 [Chloebia gouldiae]|uniref:Uncharacterized protein n=1 Tax=Chloebia gouldiae TaxID=44316 RepID=A0A3L8RRR4_CHLGU|nr:hypothetical protein DV515_00016704 [Chloebia gouldiae]
MSSSAPPDEKRPRFFSLNRVKGDSGFRGCWWPRRPSQGGMGISTHKELRQGCHFRGKAIPQLSHSRSTRKETSISPQTSSLPRTVVAGIKFCQVCLRLAVPEACGTSIAEDWNSVNALH